jgi:uncharacterized membrane protein YqiK
MGRRGFAVVGVIIVAAIVAAFGWFFSSEVKKPSAPQGIVVDNGAEDNTLREGRAGMGR